MEDMRKESRKKTVLVCGAAVGIYAGLKYLFPLAAPFLLAFGIVYLLNPWLNRVRRRTRIRKEILLAGVLVLAAAAAAALVCGVFQYGAVQAGELSENWDEIYERVGGQIGIFFGDCCMFVEEHFGVNAGRVEQAVLTRLDILAEEMRMELVPSLMKESWWYGKKLVSAVAFVGVTFIASLLLCRDYDRMMARLREGGESGLLLEKTLGITERVIRLAAVYLKAQAVILLLIMVICAAGLWIGRVEHSMTLGILAGFLDMLPFIGTSIVLLPAAFWQLVNGRIGAAVWCVVIYVACVGTREFLEPKLMGKRTGIYPILMLLSVYAGVKLFGLSGILKGPLAAVILTELFRGETDSGADEGTR